MQQICDGYNPQVLMGNWFEQSYAVQQPYRTQPDKQCRPSEIDIGYVDAHLKLRPLNRVARMPHWNTTGLVQAPQFSGLQEKTTQKQNFDVGITGHFFKSWKPTVYDKNPGAINEDTKVYPGKQESTIKINKWKKEHSMFNEHNINELLNDRSADSHSFKSSIRPNQHIPPQILLQTIYQRDISDKHKEEQKTAKQQLGVVPQLVKPAFRRIRSEITLKNMPLIQTYK